MRNFKKTIAALTATAALVAGSGGAIAKDGKALTWGSIDYSSYTTPSGVDFGPTWDAMTDPDGDGVQDIVMVGCKGCDAYKGDTNINITNPLARKRILCFVPGTEPEPTGWTALFSQLPRGNKAIANPLFYVNYSGGQVGLTDPVDATTLTSRAVGDQICQTQLSDTNARMAEWHDNGVGGHNMGARIHPNSKVKSWLRNSYASVRFWVAINGQPANPWNP